MGLYDFFLRKKEALERELFPMQEKIFFSLSGEEKLFACRIVRETLGRSFQKDSLYRLPAIPRRFEEQTTLCVAYWVKGMLRGSQIIVHKPFLEALREAALRAASDLRFKPLAEEELSDTRIEITRMSQTRALLSDQEIKNDVIDPLKGYRIAYRDRTGWFLPEVFNCMRFRNLQEFLESLIKQKAGLPKTDLPKAAAETFGVEDFIESRDLSRAIALAGPVLQDALMGESIWEKGWRESLEMCLRNAANHLLRIQEADGNIPPIINPLTGKENQIDWVRLACTAEAIAILGRESADEPYTALAEKAAAYLGHHLYAHSYLSPYVRTLSRVYYAKLLLVLGREAEGKNIVWKTYADIDTIRYEPILFLQAASLFASCGSDEELSRKAESIFERCFADYAEKQKKGERIELARFPEMILIAWRLFEKTGKGRYKEKALQIEGWLKEQQLTDGSFPSVTGSAFSYTRGTGKIFEVLALRPQENETAILKAFQWIRNMQYTEESAYFIPSKFLGRPCL